MVVVVGYIPTPEGRAALTAAIEQARLREARLLVVNASRGDARWGESSPRGNGWDLVEGEITAAGIEHQLIQDLGSFDVAEQVLDLATTHDARLIVIGLRRRSPLGKLILGSAAQRILLEATCPVYAVKAESPPQR